MIGIDIVDLTDPLLQKRGERPLNLIKHPNDQFPDDCNPFWLLWTAKEAVFKSFRKDKAFSPTDIEVQISQRHQGIYNYQSDQYSGVILGNHHFVCAVGSMDMLPEFRIFYSPQASKSTFIRQKISESTNPLHKLEADELGLPIISPTRQLISISHHHHYAAFAVSS